jgi:hypothetical protein
MRSRTPSRRRSPRSVLGPIATAIACSLALTVLAPSAASAADAAAPAASSTSEETSAPTALAAAAAPSDTDAAPAASTSESPAPSTEPAAPQAPAPQPAPVAPAPAPSTQPVASTEPVATTEPAPPTQTAPGGDASPTPSAPAPEQPAAPAAPDESTPQAPAAPTESPVAELADAPIAPLAVGGPEAEVETPSLHWLVSPAAAGATFEVQHRSRTGTVLAGETWWADWSAWSASAAIADCTSGCSTSGDLDPDVGELQVSQVGADPVTVNSATAQHEYRVRPATPPAGRFWTDTSWRTASLTSASADLGTFTTTANAALVCTAGSFYSLSSTGVITRVTPTGGGTSTSEVFATVPNLGNNEANALGIGPGGTTAFLIERPSSNASGIGAFHHYSVSQGWQRIPLANDVSLASARYTAGAVNLADGSFYFAAFTNGQSQSVAVYRFTPATGITRLGLFSTQETTQQATGDLAFDAAGNLYVAVTSSTTGSPTRVYTIAAQTLAAANSATLAVAAFTPIVTGFSDVVGAAFNADGRLYLGSATAVRSYNPSSQTFDAGNAAGGLSSTDLASCQTPSTLTVVKDVVARAAAGDQFTISSRTSTGAPLASATTAGTSTGVQAAQAGPVAALAGGTYSFTETFSNSNASSYATSFSCVDQNGSALPVDTSTAGSGRVTIATAGTSVTCTIRNSPLTGSVTIRKVVEDVGGANRSPGAGWSVSTSVTATTPTVTLSGAAQQQTNAQGVATWGLAFGSASARATVSVAEVQQPGYAFQEGACIVRPIASAPFVQSFTTEGGAQLQQVAPGTRIECSFVNRLQPTRLTLVNQAADADPAAWSLSATPTGGSPIAFTTGVAQDVAPGAYQLAATGGPATHVGGAWSCVDHGGATVSVTNAHVTVPVGTRVACTIVQQTAHVVLLKRIDAAMAGSLLPEDFELTAAPVDATLGLSPTTVQGAEAADADNTVAVRPGAAYALSESSSYAYLQLRLQRLEGSSWVDVTSNEITAPAPGQTATYRFVNAAPPALALPLTGGLGADAYLFAGLALLVLSAAALLIRMRVVRLRGRRT